MSKGTCAKARRLYSAATVLATALFPLVLQAQQPPPQPPPVTGARLTSDQAMEVYISEDAVQGMYARQLNIQEFGRTEVRAGVFYNEARDLIAIADGLARIGEIEQRRLTFGAGPRMYAAFLNTENEDIFAIGIGGEARYRLGREQSASIMLAAYYAPDIMTFGTADNMSDVTLRIDFGLNSAVNVFAGYRILEIETLTEDREIDDHLHLGFRWNF